MLLIFKIRNRNEIRINVVMNKKFGEDIVEDMF